MKNHHSRKENVDLPYLKCLAENLINIYRKSGFCVRERKGDRERESETEGGGGWEEDKEGRERESERA